MLETTIFGRRYCIIRSGGATAREVVLGKVDSVSQPGHWRSISLFTPRDAQSDSRIFSIIYLRRKSLCFPSYDRGLLFCLKVVTQSPLAGRKAVQTLSKSRVRSPGRARCSSACLFCICRASSCQACLWSLRYCLSVRPVCLPVSYN